MNLQQMLEREEGRKKVAYPDPLTHGAPWTIGIGHTGPEVHAGLVWDDNQIDFAYQLDAGEATQGCLDHLQPWFTDMNDARQAVLIGMAFQMGTGGLLEFVHTIAAVRDGRYADAAQGICCSKWGTQTPGRARRMADQLSSGNWS